jgi:hypothetical protein
MLGASRKRQNYCWRRRNGKIVQTLEMVVLAPLVFLFFLILALLQGSILSALGWLCFLVNGILLASGVYTRSWMLSSLALAFALLGILLLGTSIVRDFIL